MPAPEYERFSDDAHLAVVLAERDARLAGQDVVSVEHLLVALAECDDEVRDYLEQFGISLDELRDRVADWSQGGAPVERALFSPTLRRTVQLAGRLAGQERSSVIEGRHLLIALVDVEDEFVLRVLISLGVDPAALRRHAFSEPAGASAVADRARRTLRTLLTGR